MTPEATRQPQPVRTELTGRYLCTFDTDGLASRRVDVLVVGSGIAGLTAALLAPEDLSVSVVTKSGLTQTGTGFAQGGIAGALGEEDSTGLHFEDTMRAGDGLCDPAAVAVLVTEARGAVEWLIQLGADFDRLGGEIAFAREGGHSLPRILHAGDTTGSEIQETLARAARSSDRIDTVEKRFLVDLLTFDGRAVGALLADMETGALEVVWANQTVLATGGSGHLYAATTNPAIATGDGIAAAYRAGAEVRDLEFVQFHPTALDTLENPRFLISEALRGEGAVLTDPKGCPFMKGRHPMADLAPRDVVVRAIVDVMRESGTDHVWLDARKIGAKKLAARFPAIYARCKEGGFDLAKDLVPVRPAAHYMVGGVRADIDGQTSLPGLFVSGECASTGVHGANRLASNSLLEGLVFSQRIAAKLERGPRAQPPRIQHGPVGDASAALSSETSPAEAEEAEAPPSAVDTSTVQRIMSERVGVVRDAEGLSGALDLLRPLGLGARTCGVEVGVMEAYNLLALAELVAASALKREESRGTHSRSDFPARDDLHWTERIIHRRGREPWTEVV